MHRNNLGLLLAVLAGVLTFASAVWAIVPAQARGDLGALWWLRALIVSGAFIAAAFTAERHTPLAKGILVVGALVLLGTALLTGWASEPGSLTVPSFIFDLAPALVALVAAVLIGPIHRSRAEIEAQRSGARFPEQPVPPEQQVRPRPNSGIDSDRVA